MEKERYYHSLNNPVQSQRPWIIDPAWFYRCAQLEDHLVPFDGKLLLVVSKRTDCFWRDHDHPDGKFEHSRHWTNVPGILAGHHHKVDQFGDYSEQQPLRIDPAKKEEMLVTLASHGYLGDVRFGEWRC